MLGSAAAGLGSRWGRLSLLTHPLLLKGLPLLCLDPLRGIGRGVAVIGSREMFLHDCPCLKRLSAFKVRAESLRPTLWWAPPKTTTFFLSLLIYGLFVILS